ncbi:hypothetical protein PR048_009276 [Dryococelus australis]|uniref:Uncharacterized protein n=1 Tax=Dryococelus australis TaxID=614101 RepID=A0ABQ9HZH5_9NEOP|nr:hypothetical protein PR048_009276 [Dryococelus australis]
MRVIEENMERLWNEGAGETADPREKPPTHGIVRHDSHLRKSGLSGAGVQGRGNRDIPEKTRRPTASSGTIPTCENPVTQPGIEPGSPWWEASVLITQPPRPLLETKVDVEKKKIETASRMTQLDATQTPGTSQEILTAACWLHSKKGSL